MAVYLGSEMVNAFSGIPQSLNGENKTAITTALTNKGVTVPDDMGINDIAALIEAIEAGGNIRIEQGSVTFSEDTSGYKFVSDNPDIFIAYVEDDTDPEYSRSQYVWAFIQDTRLYDRNGKQTKTAFYFGYNKGTQKYYVPLKGSYDIIGGFTTVNFNGCLGATTYKYYAIYGVTAI